MVCELTLRIDAELEKEMSEYPEVDWAEVIRNAIRKYVPCRGIAEMYTAPIERALVQEK